ncbi:HU family DNA-binding protein [Nonomuraea basaltis]|uniref:HU family DNA-binding protein n=1 Tax=Nonomuraea basaltis TaxID=2495887 RepID=UPI00110C7064|nr:HU family DNA-binding protein [Nonomuraea basaltis]TMR92830.1 HU family DNA-binding protein [Nonomuraea basaltis]
MNKADLIEEWGRRTDAPSKAAAKRGIEAFIDIIVSTVAKGDEVRIGRFGIFDRVYRKARVARDPNTNEEIGVPGKWVMRFRPAKGAKDAVSK